MPARYTFQIPCIAKLLKEEMTGGLWVDPFCGIYSPANARNDHDDSLPADRHEDGLEFLRSYPVGSADGVIFDPPYSCEQALRSYKPIHNGNAGREEYKARCLDEIGRIIRLGGKLIHFGWHSNGAGMNRGFALNRIMLVAHGACHNDTIVTVEIKKWHQTTLWER